MRTIHISHLSRFILEDCAQKKTWSTCVRNVNVKET